MANINGYNPFIFDERDSFDSIYSNEFSPQEASPWDFSNSSQFPPELPIYPFVFPSETSSGEPKLSSHKVSHFHPSMESKTIPSPEYLPSYVSQNPPVELETPMDPARRIFLALSAREKERIDTHKAQKLVVENQVRQNIREARIANSYQSEKTYHRNKLTSIAQETKVTPDPVVKNVKSEPKNLDETRSVKRKRNFNPSYDQK